MKLIFRYDDFAFHYSQQNYAVCEQVFNVFLSLNLPIVVGVIPSISAEVWNRHNTIFYQIENDTRSVRLLNSGLEKGFQLALHGLTHQTYSDGGTTEYSNRPYQSQLESIKKGVNHLSRVFPNAPLDVFIPPWNSFDHLTVDAVGKVGIRTFCCGENIKAYNQNGVLVVPAWPLKGLINYVDYYSLDNLTRLVGDSWIVIMMHSYDFVETEIEHAVSLTKFRALLHEIRMKKIDVGILPVDAEPIGFTPRHECLVRARLDLLRRGSKGFGKNMLRAGHIIRHTLGQRTAEKTLDTVAFGLQTLKGVRNHARRLKGKKRISGLL
jgi:predicted deacetylase